MKILLSIAFVFITLSPLSAQIDKPVPGEYTPSVPEKYIEGVVNPAEIILNTNLPLDIAFKDSEGNDLTLAQIFNGDKPVLLCMMYFKCQSTCGPLMNEIYTKVGGLNIKPGKDYNLVFISMEPKEGPEVAAPKKAGFVDQFHYANGNGHYFLTTDQANVNKISKALDFKFAKIKDSFDYSHPTVAYFITPKGKISRFFTGFGYNPQDIKFSLLNAGEGKIGSLLDNILVRCYTFDSQNKRYVRNSMVLMSIAGALTLLALGTFLGILWYQDLKKNKKKSTT